MDKQWRADRSFSMLTPTFRMENEEPGNQKLFGKCSKCISNVLTSTTLIIHNFGLKSTGRQLRMDKIQFCKGCTKNTRITMNTELTNFCNLRSVARAFGLMK